MFLTVCLIGEIVASHRCMKGRVCIDLESLNGHTACAFGSLEQAHRFLDREHPTAVLLDLMLPEGSGLELFDSQLFGHEKGAFTGADQKHAGFFERANDGTLFLDEITEMLKEMQTHLLRELKHTIHRAYIMAEA